MTLPVTLRSLATLLAVIGVIDPVWHVQSRQPRPIDFRGSETPDRPGRESPVKARLQALLGREATFDSSAAPIARVVVAATVGDAVPPGTIPTSIVEPNASAPNVRIVAVEDPPDGIVGWRTVVPVTIEGHGLSGSTATVVLQQSGTEISRVEHKWTRPEERAVVSLPYIAPSEGAARLSIRIVPLEGERDVEDNRADVRVLSRDRRFRILVHEPRPSWATTFVRRVLEENRAFDVASFAEASKGRAVRTRDAPVRLATDLDAFDAVIVAAPEELSKSDVEALNRFARSRGGSVLLLPDRRPSGPYVSLLGFKEFDEVLLEKPIAATGTSAGTIRASELVLPRQEPAEADVLAVIEHGGKRRSIVYGWPAGFGRVIFSGALDAWRFRAMGEQQFARFWTAIVAGASLAAPARLELRVEPGAARPGQRVAIRARVRDSSADSLHATSVRARLISASGEQTPVRLWPGLEPGAFEGDIAIDAPGTYDVHVASGEISADTVVLVADDVRRPVEAGDRYQAIAAATGGVVATPDDLTPLADSIRALPAPTALRELRPARSTWFAIVFAALLCAEWTMRRRAGQP